jgi:hypothetical protein
MDSSGAGRELLAGFEGHGSVTSNSIKDGEFLEQLRDY